MEESARATMRGTVTAASIWNTGAIGAVVAYKHYEIALILSLINFATLRRLEPLKRKAKEQNNRQTQEKKQEERLEDHLPK